MWVNPQGEEKYFNSITGWRIEKSGANPESAPPFEPVSVNNQPDPSDDLPY